jgi:type I restriction enzyme R subunit
MPGDSLQLLNPPIARIVPHLLVTALNSEDRLVQATFAEYLEHKLGWDSIFAWNQETFGLGGTLGRTSTREVVLT